MSSRPALFATRLGIKNFRGYGPEFELRLPARPCVVLLSGPNGLGKTSLFEAVEWALTGAVKRLDQLCGASADPHDMVRRAPDVDRFEVELDFSDAADGEERVRRVQMVPASGATPASVGTAVSTIAESLRSGDPRWSVTEQNLADYLHLTHLHAQVASLRFVTFNAKERWVRVSPLAGADRFERVRLNLMNSKGSITRLAKDRAQDVAKAVERRQQWQNKLNRRAETKVLEAAVRDALGPREVLVEVSRARRALALPSESEVLGDDEPDVTRAGQAIQTLRGEIERAREESVSRSEVLGRLRAVPRQWAQNRQQIALLEPRITALRADGANERRQAEQRAALVQGRVTTQEAALRERDRSTKRHERLLGALRDREDVERLALELADADAQLQVAEKARETADVELRKLREDLASRDEVMTAREDARKKTGAVGEALRALSESEALHRQLVVEEARSATAATSLRTLIETSAALAEAIREKQRLVGQAEQLLDVRRKSAASLQQALLGIAEHLTDEDTACPVCRTSFRHGELRALAREAIENLDPTLATGEAAVASAREELEDLRRRERQLAQDQRKVEADAKTVNATVAELNRRILALRSHPLVGGGPPPETLDRLMRQEAELKGDLQRVERALGNSRSAEDLRQLIVEGAGAVEDKKRTYALAHERRKAREARLAEVRARMTQLADEEPSVATEQALRLAAQGAALDAAKAKENAEAAATALEEAKAAETASQLKLRALEEELSNVEAERAAYASAVTSFEGQWTTAGLEQPIAEGALDGEVNGIAQARRSLESVLASLSGLPASLERWRQAASLQALEEEIRGEHGNLDIETYTQELDDALAAARAALTKAERARIAADELSDTLKRVTSEFGDRALKPFGDLFRRYLRALVHDERFHSIEVNYQSAARAAGLRFLVGLGESTSADTEAEYILSEGQLGEVSLAAMLAASTAFPWSRWKALLMDDPTQYNDLIHATALFDVLRNLVRSEGYQVFVSTHDSEQAGFLRRKLDGIGIDWIDCRYLGHGANGILVELTQRMSA